jgi:hypothetical protein
LKSGKVEVSVNAGFQLFSDKNLDWTMEKDAPPSSHSSFQRLEKIMKTLRAAPTK